MTPRFDRCFTTGRQVATRIGMSAALIAAMACGSNSNHGTGPTGPTTGVLTVNITAPTGVTPNVTVSGPAGYSRTLAATTTITGLTAGSYSIVAASVVGSDPIVGTFDVATVSGSPATVTAGGTAGGSSGAAGAAASATYSARAGSGGLWAANNGSLSVVQYTSAQLAAGTSSAATFVDTTAAGVGQNLADAFDANGNLWVSNAQSIKAFPASSLPGGGTLTPSIVLGGFTRASGIAFDANGNLWIANSGTSSVVELTASQLTSSGSPAFAVNISATGSSLDQPAGLAFDASGNLWVANTASNTVVEFTPAQLAATGSPAPTVTISPNTNSINAPLLIAFDGTGGLWIANGGLNNTVVGYSATQLAASGNPVPHVTLNATAGSLSNPAGLAFDASGNLWVSNFGTASIVEFTSSQIAASGAPTPTLTVNSSSLSEPLGLAFNAHATGLPIKP